MAGVAGGVGGDIGIAQEAQEAVEELSGGDGLLLAGGDGGPALVHGGVQGVALNLDAGEADQEGVGLGAGEGCGGVRRGLFVQDVEGGEGRGGPGALALQGEFFVS